MLIGIVGKANVGKSTFFKSVTLADILIANYPFATIDPNRGFGFVRIECVDKEFDVQCTPRLGYCQDHTRFVPVEVIDVAGLVPGAHLGKGKGNKFLDDLRPADVLIHVVDIAGSTKEKGEPVEVGSYDPAEDIKFLEVELDMWYVGILKKGWDKFARRTQQEQTEISHALAKQLSGLNVTEDMIKDVVKKLDLDPTKVVSWTEDDLMHIAMELRKITKPLVIAANKIDLPGAAQNFERIKKEFPDYVIIPCSSEAELALKEAAKQKLIEYLPGDNSFKTLKEMNEKQQTGLKFIKENILTRFNSTGVQAVLNTAVFDVLQRIVVFPGGINNLQDSKGRTLPDCFVLPKGSTALDFAYKIHTDLGDKFIRAIDVKTKKTIGKEHIVQHRDVIEIITRK